MDRVKKNLADTEFGNPNRNVGKIHSSQYQGQGTQEGSKNVGILEKYIH